MNNQKITPPKAPRFRTLNSVIEKKLPVVLRVNHPTEPVLSPLNDVFILRPLKLPDEEAFYMLHGKSIHDYAQELVYIYGAVMHDMQAIAKHETENPGVPFPADFQYKLQKDADEFGVEYLRTPFGAFYGDWKRAVSKLCAFVMSRGGKVVGYEKLINGEWQPYASLQEEDFTETNAINPSVRVNTLPVAYEEVAELLSEGDVFRGLDNGDGSYGSLFQDVLIYGNLMDENLLTVNSASGVEEVDEESGNFTETPSEKPQPQEKGTSSTKSISKTNSEKPPRKRRQSRVGPSDE